MFECWRLSISIISLIHVSITSLKSQSSVFTFSMLRHRPTRNQRSNENSIIRRKLEHQRSNTGTAYEKSDVDSTYSCNPINSSSLPPNLVLDTSTNASWVTIGDLSHLEELWGPMPDDMDGSEFPPQNLTDYVTLPACTEGAVLSSYVLGSYCGVNCAEGYAPNVTTPDIEFVGDREGRRRLVDGLSESSGKTKVHGRLTCDSNSKDVKADITCVEMSCLAISYDNATAQVMGPTQDAFGCESGLELQRFQNCTWCGVRARSSRISIVSLFHIFNYVT